MSEASTRRGWVLAGAVVTVAGGLIVSAGGCAKDSTPGQKTPVASVASPRTAGQIEFTKETLPNGLRVIYAPMDNAPVVHVRVLYNVGSRDENPERQGFAHLFEHMMFRGSQHVAPELHMKLIGEAGGISNAFTSYDQTTYINTIPSSHTDMALWLEADRMASFKVSDEIFTTERKVVAEEWRLRTANPPSGTLPQDFARLAYQKHPYRWTPIGDMDQLARSTTPELQAFFNKYYVPNNACLIIAGDIDVAEMKKLVRKYYGWMPRGADIDRGIEPEPDQTETRKLVVYRRRVPLPEIAMGFKTTDYRSPDHVALDAIGSILSRGRSSRLNKLLVNPPAGSKPMALQASAGNGQLQDVSTFSVRAVALPGTDPDAVEAAIKGALAEFAQTGPTPEELAAYKVRSRQGLLRSRETAEGVASQLGEAEVFGGDASLVNRQLADIEALTPETLKNIAAKYLRPERLTVVQYLPDPTGTKARAEAAKSPEPAPAAPVVSGPVAPKPAPFPASYPKAPPVASLPTATYNTGVVGTVSGVQVVTLRDTRLPLASFSLVLRGGSDAEPDGKTGLASATAQMLRRGSTGFDASQLAEELESRGVNIDVSSGGDTTQISGSASSDLLDYAIDKAALVLYEPTFPESEFNRLKQQSIQGLRRALTNGTAVARRELSAAMWQGTPFAAEASAETLAAISLADVKDWYAKTYRKDGAFIVFTGDVTPDRAMALATKLVARLPDGAPPKAAYNVPTAPTARRIILIDNPDAKQSNILVGFRAYTNRSEERFAGSVATQVLSSGIDSRMGRYLRADRGLTYGASGRFSSGRYNGAFVCSTDTNPETTGASVEGIFKVLEDIRKAPITDAELAAAKSRSAGGAILQTQTIQQQAGQRTETLLNGWPENYYQNLPKRIAAVTKSDVQAVMNKYASPDNATIVVVGPAASVKPQLEPFGKVEVLPMPLDRKPDRAALQ